MLCTLNLRGAVRQLYLIKPKTHTDTKRDICCKETSPETSKRGEAQKSVLWKSGSGEETGETIHHKSPISRMCSITRAISKAWGQPRTKREGRGRVDEDGDSTRDFLRKGEQPSPKLREDLPASSLPGVCVTCLH